MATGDESASAWKVVFLAGIIAAVVGLKLVPGGKPADTATEPAAD
jgi:quaternary ammonium compound-resistance protein SugE